MDMGNVEPASVSTTVPEVACSVAEKHQRSDDLQLDVEEGHVRVPAEKLRKIIEELVDNACKFSEAGKPVQLRGQLKGNAYVISVVDQGRGMTPEQISKIGPHMQFERDTYEQQGSGLGLIIAKRLTELMGGQLNIRSVYGEGTTVELLFTVAPQSQG
ncbi:ATP-binding protein [Candidatus Parcubacteria bacterium]|nr:MAG: ATP-binding protein [Candidatus Parcubacteria bacterium]